MSVFEGYEPNGPRGQQYCKVCDIAGGGITRCCDVCGEMIHERCAVEGRGFVVYNLCYDEMLVQYGHQQISQQEWLQRFLQRAREQRQREQHLRQQGRVLFTGDVVESIASTTGALLGGAASSTARGLVALSRGAKQGATAAWGAEDRQEPVPEVPVPPGLQDQRPERPAAVRGDLAAAEAGDREIKEESISDRADLISDQQADEGDGQQQQQQQREPYQQEGAD